MVALTGNRTFIMRSIHEKEPILFQTRWTLSYLRGPLTLVEVSSLMKNGSRPALKQIEKVQEKSSKPEAASGIPEFFITDVNKKRNCSL